MGRRDGEGEEKQGKGTERSYPPFAYRITETDWNHLWKRIIKLSHCSHLEHISQDKLVPLEMFVEFIMSTVQDRWKLIAHLFVLVCKRQSQWNKHNFGCSDLSTTDGDKVLTES